MAERTYKTGEEVALQAFVVEAHPDFPSTVLANLSGYIDNPRTDEYDISVRPSRVAESVAPWMPVEHQAALLRVVRAVHALKKTRNPWLKEGRQATIALLKEYGTLPPHILARLNEEERGERQGAN